MSCRSLPMASRRLLRSAPGLVRHSHTASLKSFTIPIHRSSPTSASASEPNPASTATTFTTSYLYRKLSSPFSSPTSPSPSQPGAKDFDPRAPEPTNPIDRITWDRYERAQTAYITRRSSYYALGIVGCMTVILGITTIIGDPENLNKDKQVTVGKGLQCDGPAGLTTDGNPDIITRDGIQLIATESTNVPYFPKHISIPRQTPGSTADDDEKTPEDDYVLVGQGVRTVSFLGIKVYVLGMYVRSSQIDILRSQLSDRISSSTSPDSHSTIKTALVDPTLSYEIWNDLLRFKSSAENHNPTTVDTIFRIVPTRSTDFNHMRDGWVNGIRAVTNDFRQRRKDHELTIKDQANGGANPSSKSGSTVIADSQELESESFASAMRSFQSLFGGRGKVPFGNALLLHRYAKDGSLSIMVEDQPSAEDGKKQKKADTLIMGSPVTRKVLLGQVADERVSRVLWLRYLAGKDVSSEPARQSIVDGLSLK